MAEEETSGTAISRTYVLELRMKALEESIRQDQTRRLDEQVQELANEVEKRLARRWRMLAGMTSGGNRA